MSVDDMISMEERFLRQALLEGKQYSSAHHFYNTELAGRSFIVANDGDDIEAAQKIIRKSTELELERLQQVYARKWKVEA